MPKKAKGKGGKKKGGKKKKEAKVVDPLVVLQKEHDALVAKVNAAKDGLGIECDDWEIKAIEKMNELEAAKEQLEDLKVRGMARIAELEESEKDLKKQLATEVPRLKEALRQAREEAGKSLANASKGSKKQIQRLKNKIDAAKNVTGVVYDIVNTAFLRYDCNRLVEDIEKNVDSDGADDTEFDLAELKLDLNDRAVKKNTKKRITKIHEDLREILHKQAERDQNDLDVTVRNMQQKAFGNALRTVDRIMMDQYGDFEDEKGDFSAPHDQAERLQQELHEVHEENERLQLKYKHLLDNEQIDSKDKERLLVEIETLREDLNYKDDEIRRLEFHNRQLEDEAQRQLHYAAEAKNRFNIQKFQMSDLLAKLEHERRRNETLMDDNRRLRMEIMEAMKKARTNAAEAKKSKKHENLTKDQNEHISLLESECSVTKRALDEAQRKNEDLFNRLNNLTGQHDELSAELLGFREKMAEREETIRQLRHGGARGEAINPTKTRDDLEDALSAAKGRLRMLNNSNNELEEQTRLLKNKVNNQRIIINRYEDADHPSESRKVVELRMALRQKSRIIGALETQVKQCGQEPDYLPPREAMSVAVKGKDVKHYSSGLRRNELLLMS